MGEGSFCLLFRKIEELLTYDRRGAEKRDNRKGWSKDKPLTMPFSDLLSPPRLYCPQFSHFSMVCSIFEFFNRLNQ